MLGDCSIVDQSEFIRSCGLLLATVGYTPRVTRFGGFKKASVDAKPSTHTNSLALSPSNDLLLTGTSSTFHVFTLPKHLHPLPLLFTIPSYSPAFPSFSLLRHHRHWPSRGCSGDLSDLHQVWLSATSSIFIHGPLLCRSTIPTSPQRQFPVAEYE
jgi:hypothetical protein